MKICVLANSLLRHKAPAFIGIVGVTILLVMACEFFSELVVGPAPLEPRFACTRSKDKDALTIFAYGGSTVVGKLMPEWGFIEQLRHTLVDRLEGQKLHLCNLAVAGQDSTSVLLDVKRTIDYRPDMLIVFSGHNEFIKREFDIAEVRGLREWAASLSTVRALNRLRRNLNRRPRRNSPSAMPRSLKGYDRNGADFRARVRRYDANMASIVRLAKEADIPLALGTLPANLRDWPPAFKTLDPASGGVENEELVTGLLRNVFEGRYMEAIAAQRELSSRDSQSAIASYVKARLLLAKGAKSARNRLVHAKDTDPIPWRALSQFNEQIRRLASGKDDGVFLIDVERIFANAADDGVPGFELVADNCHPTAYGNYIITRELLRVIYESGILDFDEHKTLRVYDLAEFDAFLVSLNNLAGLKMDYRLKNARYCMKVPFYNFAAARMYLLQARQHDASDWRISANLGALALLEGDVREGKAEVRRSLQEGATPHDLLDRKHVPYMREALAHVGLGLSDFTNTNTNETASSPNEQMP